MIIFVIYVSCLSCFRVKSVQSSLVVTYLERAYLLALLCVVFCCVLSLSCVRCPGAGVVLDYIDSWFLPRCLHILVVVLGHDCPFGHSCFICHSFIIVHSITSNAYMQAKWFMCLQQNNSGRKRWPVYLSLHASVYSWSSFEDVVGTSDLDLIIYMPVNKPNHDLKFTPPFLYFTANQFAQKFKLLANSITYFVNMCNIY